MWTLFDEHPYDVREHGLAPDRSFDELVLRIEIPDDLPRRASRP